MNQSTLLTLDATPCGCVLPTEVLAAMDVSLTLKARELGVKAFLFWGRLSTESGADYYVARAYNGTKRLERMIVPNRETKFYYSREGSTGWISARDCGDHRARGENTRDSPGTPRTCSRWRSCFHEPEPAPEPAEGEEAPEVEEPEPLPPWEITEAQYMMTRINAVNAATALAPEGMFGRTRTGTTP